MRFLLAISGLLWAEDTLYLTLEAAEAQFLRSNLVLYAQFLEIDVQKALLWQARLWPNPQLSVTQVDLFAPPNGEFSPLLQWPLAYQLAADLVQTVRTAGKYRHGIALQTVRVQIQAAAWAELLRQLRYQLHNLLRASQRDQIYIRYLARQETLLSRLTERYAKLAQEQLVSRAEYLRLEALRLSVLNALQQRRLTFEETQNQLRQLLHIPATGSLIWIVEDSFWPTLVDSLPPLAELLQRAQERADVKLAKYQIVYQERRVKLEESNAYPDLDVILSYDRLGGYRLNQLGAGFSLPLPLWNRNQGQIQAARAAQKQAEVSYENVLSTAQSEILAAWRELALLARQWDPAYLTLLQSYEETEAFYLHSLQQKRLSFLNYVDFLTSYKDLVEMITELAFRYHQGQNKLEYVSARMERLPEHP